MEKENQKVYFGAEQKKKFYLPEDKEQWIEHKKFNEGQRRQYEDATSRHIEMKEDKTIGMDLAIGTDRKALFDAAVVNYRVLEKDDAGNIQEITGFDPAVWERISNKMPGDLAQLLLEDIRDFNPWLKPDTEDKKKV